jgi:hypothetical protein
MASTKQLRIFIPRISQVIPRKPHFTSSQLQQIRHASVRRRSAAEKSKQAPYTPKPPKQEPSKVFAPKTRIVVGIIFIGAMIYSMVIEQQKKLTYLADSYRELLLYSL